MGPTDPLNISDILNQVRTWTPGMRIALARKVLETLDSPTVSEPPRTMSLEDVTGLLRTDGPPPDDDQCDTIVNERRARKYG